MSFSIVELDVAATCTRACTFCPPRAPGPPSFLPVAIQEAIADELLELGYAGTITLSGFSEPLLLPGLTTFLRRLRRAERATILVVTNGDRLDASLLEELDGSVDRLAVSVYDGSEREEELRRLLAGARLRRMRVELRDRHSHRRFVNNRGGALATGSQPRTDACYYPFYCCLVDHTGQVFFCPHNFRRRDAVGRLGGGATLRQVWEGERFEAVRAILHEGRAALDACRACDVHGRLEGRAAHESWVEGRRARGTP
jgi:organic radical activating enzyme